jgi:uncharacterized iron-regulated membrane protein
VGLDVSVATAASGRRRPWGPRRLVYTAHLWLGLLSGLVVFLVGLTGALYVFEREIKELYLRSYTRVSPPGAAHRLPVSALHQRGTAAVVAAVGTRQAPDNSWIVLSARRDRAALYSAYWATPRAWYEVYLDPYRGDVLTVRDQYWDPLNVVLRLHRSLLLPEEVGRWIVGIAVLVCVVMLITGLVLWCPRRPGDLREAGALRQRLSIRWRGRRPRMTYDLHRVLGFYAFLATLIIAVTGLVWSFRWVDRAVYWVATGGGTPAEPPAPRSTKPDARDPVAPHPADHALAAVAREFPDAVRYELIFPSKADGALQACANPEETTYYRIDCLWFDQHSGHRVNAELYLDKNAGEMLRAMNYDIHVGQILGLPGRVLACAASLIVASLPVTGVLMWWGRGGKRTRLRRPGSSPKPNGHLSPEPPEIVHAH